MRAIDADAFKAEGRELYRYKGWDLRDVHYSQMDVECNIDNMPTIEVEPYIEFCNWVAEEIFGAEGDYWEKVQDAFPELACRRLQKLGIVHKEGGTWLWVDRKELEE